jgi:hypothetical protein
MFGDFQYTTMRKEMPLQNALFLLIPVSYVAGWTLAIERQGRIYNSKHMPGQLRRWGFSQESVNIITSGYWRSLHQIDNRFLVDGIAHNSPKQFLPITEIVDKLNEIDNEVRLVVERIRRDEGIQI